MNDEDKIKRLSLLEHATEVRQSQTLPPRDGKSLAMKPLPGFAWNPLRTLPRNIPCPCLSGRKFKTCCLIKLPPVVPAKDAEAFLEQMSKPDLVFLTKENEGRIGEAVKARQAEMAQLQATCEHSWVNRVVPPGGGEAKSHIPVCELCGANYDAEKHGTTH